MTTRRDFIRTMSVASAGIALGSNGILNAATNMPNQKPKGEKVKIAYIGIGKALYRSGEYEEAMDYYPKELTIQGIALKVIKDIR